MELTARGKSVNLQMKVIWLFLIVNGFWILVVNFSRFNVNLLGQVAVFILISFVARLMPTRLPQGNDFSVAFIIDLIVITLYGTPTAVVTGTMVTLFAGLFSKLLGRKDSLFKIVKAAGETALIIGLAGTVYQFISHQTAAFTAATFIYFLAITISFTIDSIMISRETFSAVWLSVTRTLCVNFCVLSSLAFLLTYLIRNTVLEFKLFSILMFFVPVMLVSHAFRLSLSIKQSYLNTVRTIVRAIEAKDPYTKGHSEHVAELTVAIAKELRLPEKELQKLQYLALLHDAGKIGVPEEILNKSGPLSVEEFEEVQKHSVLGAEIIQKIKFLSSKSDVVLYHHERYDGGGYPASLEGEQIPLESRIIGVADAYDAMITDRPFRPAKSPHEAVEEITRLSGSQFDPKLVDIIKIVLRRREAL